MSVYTSAGQKGMTVYLFPMHGYLKNTFWGLFAAAMAVVLTALPFSVAVLADGPAPTSYETAALTEGDAFTLPPILADADIDRYTKIFALQEDGRWKQADRLIAGLGDRLLLGHVLAQRYLHPTKYRSRYKELKAWMEAYADHPDARRIYKLALRRKPKNWRAPKRPVAIAWPQSAAEVAAAGRAAAPGNRLNKAQRQKVRNTKRQIRWYVKKGWTLAVKKLLLSDEVKRLFSTVEYDRARARLGAGYFAAGRDEWALKWAGGAAQRSGAYIPGAHWTAGLAAWRLQRFELAAKHFEATAKGDADFPWMASAAAFWAARSHLVDRRPERVNQWLGVAATHPRTFYGLLARRMLGLKTAFRWVTPELETEAVEGLAAIAAGRRALGLLQLGQYRRAERDLRLLSMRSEGATLRHILALAGRVNMPALAVRLDKSLYPAGGGYDSAAYPVPRWTPAKGFRVDRALIYALIRQESGFNPEAKSWAGAMGLMQLMPRTASFVGRDRRLRGSRRHVLYEPKVNLELGQKYIEMLLGESSIKDRLFLLAAAWNGGPGNLNKWRREIKHLDDPLFFIESIPSRETRNFIERVLANLWIYRDRLGQPMPSLDAIAAGEWPVYTALDPDVPMVAENGEQPRRASVPSR